jgi:hypothetical protein
MTALKAMKAMKASTREKTGMKASKPAMKKAMAKQEKQHNKETIALHS